MPRTRRLVNLAAVAVLAAVTVGWVLTQVVGSGGALAGIGGEPEELRARLTANDGLARGELGLLDRHTENLWRSPDGREFYRLRLGLVYDNVRSSWPCKYGLPEEWERFPHERAPRTPRTNSRCRGRGGGEEVARSLVAALEEWARANPSTVPDTTPASPPRRAASSSDVRFIWPLIGEITSFFGNDDGRDHTGFDINGDTGDPFVASASGRVALVEPYFGYGSTVILDHGNGLSTLYGHLSEYLVRVGDAVEQGDVIGLIGCTGSCTGDHLHFEVRVDGEPVDPLPYLTAFPQGPSVQAEADLAPDALGVVRRARN